MGMKIALWGYGYFGHDVEKAISESWTDDYEITAVFDKNFRKMNSDPAVVRVIRDPDTAAACYGQGLFDKVLITVYLREERALIKAILDLKNVPVLDVDSFNTFKDGKDCAQSDPGVDITQPGYTVFTFRDQRLYFVPRAAYPIVYDTDLAVNSAYWREYQIKQEVFPRFFKPPAATPEHVLRGEYCFLNTVYSKNYWHFTYELLDRLWIMKKNGFDGKYIIPRTAFSDELMQLTGVPEKQIIWTEDLRSEGLWRIEKLIYPFLRHADRAYASPVLREMADAIIRSLDPGKGHYPDRIYVKRVGIRKLTGCDEMLDRYGFVTVVPDGLSVKEQIRYFMNATIVFCPHGANTANALFMKPGSVLIESFPAIWLNPCCIREVLDRGVYYLPIFEHKDMAAEGAGYESDYSVQPEMIEAAMNNAIRLTEGAN